MPQLAHLGCALLCLSLLTPAGLALAQEDLFAEAGQSMSRSKWVTLRSLPLLEVALASDDKVMVKSKNHSPRGLAMRIDGEAVAGECEVTDTEEQSTTYTTETEKDKKKDTKVTTGTENTITTTTYYSTCTFDEGTSDRAVAARELTLQLAMDEKTTKAHHLGEKQMQRFQTLSR